MREPTSRREHLCWLVIGLVVLALSATGSNHGDTVVRVGGWALPTTCSIKLATGVDCAGCGLSRAFVALAHGDLQRALAFHLAAPALFLLVVAQTLWRAAVLLRPTLEPSWGPRARYGWHAFVVILLVSVVAWCLRLLGLLPPSAGWAWS